MNIDKKEIRRQAGELIAVELKLSEGVIHTSTLREVMERNMKNALKDRSNDYMLIALVDTKDEADRFRQSLSFANSKPGWWPKDVEVR